MEREDQYVEEQELVVCSCIVYFVYSFMLLKILFMICCRTVLRMVTTMRERDSVYLLILK